MVEWWALNPNCFPYNILFWSKYEYNLLYITDILSNILERQGNTNIGLKFGTSSFFTRFEDWCNLDNFHLSVEFNGVPARMY